MHTKTCQTCKAEFSKPSKAGWHQWHATRFCSKRCKGIGTTLPYAERFWGLVEKGVDCWMWLGGLWNGYGYFDGTPVPGNGKFRELAHRLAYTLAVGPIPEGLQVCHKCDVPTCVRPDHLFLGTQADNVADMRAKGRQRYGNHKREANPNVKLSESDVEEIKRLYPGTSQTKLAKQFGVAQAHVSRIILGKAWREV